MMATNRDEQLQMSQACSTLPVSFCFCDKYHDQSNLGEEKGLFKQVIVHIEKGQDRSLKASLFAIAHSITSDQGRKQKSWRNATYYLTYRPRLS